jgi:hypothetical protein
VKYFLSASVLAVAIAILICVSDAVLGMSNPSNEPARGCLSAYGLFVVALGAHFWLPLFAGNIAGARRNPARTGTIALIRAIMTAVSGRCLDCPVLRISPNVQDRDDG